jgi:hypothetical protein
MVGIERTTYGGWEHIYRLHNDQIEVFVTEDVGPRVIRFGFVGGPNEFREVPEHMGKTGGDTWRSYGGHCLWHAPEHPQRTYVADNNPVSVEVHHRSLRAVQAVEALTGIEKEIEISLEDTGSHVHVIHRLRNHHVWSVELAPWALSVMAAGGVGILPLMPKGSHRENLLPSSSLVMWAYTNMADPRWTWGDRYILLRQNGTIDAPQKIGMSSAPGWAAYANKGHLFVKKYHFQPQGVYLDLGASVEMFTNTVMLEVETLGPLTLLEPGAEVVHEEHWYLFSGIPLPTSDKDVEQHVLPIIAGKIV